VGPIIPHNRTPDRQLAAPVATEGPIVTPMSADLRPQHGEHWRRNTGRRHPKATGSGRKQPKLKTRLRPWQRRRRREPLLGTIDRVPVLLAYDHGTDMVKVYCAPCTDGQTDKRRKPVWHYHGRTEGISHRVAHCIDPESRYRETGYYLHTLTDEARRQKAEWDRLFDAPMPKSKRLRFELVKRQFQELMRIADVAEAPVQE